MNNNISNNSKKCIICGKKLKNINKDKCTDCLRKIYAVSIINELKDIGISSEINFKKRDLEVLNYPDYQILDYIWTLQELNLLNENHTTNEFSLKDKETLDNFIKKYGQSSNLGENKQKCKKQNIVKKCLLCGKTLKISEFYKSKQAEKGYSDYCKTCNSLIQAYENLSSLLEYVNPEEIFKIDELYHKFNNDKLLVFAIIWNLLDNDLLETIEEEKIYKLKDETTINNFQNKVSNEKFINIINIHETTKINHPTNPKTQKSPDFDNNYHNDNVMNYFITNKTTQFFEIIVKGIINNDYLFKLLNDLEMFNQSLKRIVTYKIDPNNTEVLFELKSDLDSLNIIIDKLEKFEWIKN